MIYYHLLSIDSILNLKKSIVLWIFATFFWGFYCTVDSVVDPHRIWFGDAMNDVIITTSKFKVLEA